MMFMRNTKENGQSFILVLIILAIGALVVVPALQLSSTTINTSQRMEKSNRGLYACEAAQEIIMWKLYHGDLVDELSTPNSSTNFTVDICGTEVTALVVMRAVELEGGTILATEHTIMPTKTVSPNTHDNYKNVGVFTYTMAFEQVSVNNTGTLDVIYDITSPEFKGDIENLYVPGSSYTSTDGVNWESIADPKMDYDSKSLLRWPATGTFDSPFRDFVPGETKYFKFSVATAFNHADETVCNWIIIQVGEVFTISGPQAPIFVEDPPITECSDQRGAFGVYKTAEPTIIPPLVATNVTYTIHINNNQGNVERIWSIEDFLPPGFIYVGPTFGDVTNMAPDVVNMTINGLERQYLLWQSGSQDAQLGANGVEMAAGANMTLSFVAQAVQGTSGNYYNEVIVSPPGSPLLGPFADIIGFPPEVYTETYSWNSGIVIVPAYDTETTAEGENITANMGVDVDGVTIYSWHVQ